MTVNRLLKILLCICFCYVAHPITYAQTGPVTNNESKPKLAEMAWIAGHWRGEAMGGQFEETWQQPSGDSMIGMFKLIKNNEVVFYEFLTIVEEKDGVVLRLKHFDQDFVGWEEKDKYITFPLVSVSHNKAIFSGIEFMLIEENTMQITVAIKSEEETQKVEFVCHRSELT